MGSCLARELCSNSKSFKVIELFEVEGFYKVYRTDVILLLEVVRTYMYNQPSQFGSFRYWLKWKPLMYLVFGVQVTVLHSKDNIYWTSFVWEDKATEMRKGT